MMKLVEKAKYYIDNLDKAKKIADRGFTKLLRASYYTTARFSVLRVGLMSLYSMRNIYSRWT